MQNSLILLNGVNFTVSVPSGQVLSGDTHAVSIAQQQYAPCMGCKRKFTFCSLMTLQWSSSWRYLVFQNLDPSWSPSTSAPLSLGGATAAARLDVLQQQQWFISNYVKLPSVLWHCWLGVRKSIRPAVKVCSTIQRLCAAVAVMINTNIHRLSYIATAYVSCIIFHWEL